MHNIWVSRAAALAAVGVPALIGTQASAAITTFNFDTIIAGGIPSGSSVATLTIADSGLNSVLVTLDHNSTSSAGQFIGDLWFNLSPFVTLTQSGQTPAAKFNGGLDVGLNSEQTAGLNFDLHQQFETSNAGGGANRLKPGESVSFTLTGAGVNATSFLSAAIPNGGGRNDVFAMIHLKGLANGDSAQLGAVPVPEPTSLLIVGAGLAAALRKRRNAR